MSSLDIKQTAGDLILVSEYKQKIRNRVRYLEREEERMRAKMDKYRTNSVKRDVTTKGK